MTAEMCRSTVGMLHLPRNFIMAARKETVREYMLLAELRFMQQRWLLTSGAALDVLREKFNL